MEKTDIEKIRGTPVTVIFTEPKEAKSMTMEMVKWGIEETKRKYGKDSDQPKTYHNEEHVTRIVETVEKVGREEKLTDREVDLLKIAAGSHDVEMGLGEESENESARLCQEEMKKRGWQEPEIKVVGELIRSTKFRFEDGVIVQMVGELDEVSGEYRLGLMKGVMADADISANGGPWEVYERCGFALGREFKIINSDGPVSDEKMKEFWKWQFGFLDGLLNKRGGFYTEGAKRVFPHMGSNLERVRDLMK